MKNITPSGFSNFNLLSFYNIINPSGFIQRLKILISPKTPGTQRKILCGLYVFTGGTSAYDQHNTIINMCSSLLKFCIAMHLNLNKKMRKLFYNVFNKKMGTVSFIPYQFYFRGKIFILAGKRKFEFVAVACIMKNSIRT